MNLLTRSSAIQIMQDAGCSQAVINHCLNVATLALKIVKAFEEQGFQVNKKLVEIGSLMHDLGRSVTHSVEHGVIGGQIARKKYLPEKLVRVIERHVGAGIIAEEAETIGLPRGNYIPETLEEKIVAYADKLIEGDKQVGIEVTIEKFSKELGKNHPSINRLRTLHEEIINYIGV